MLIFWLGLLQPTYAIDPPKAHAKTDRDGKAEPKYIDKSLPSIPWDSGAKPTKPGESPMVDNVPKNYSTIELEGEVVDAWCWSSGVMGEGRGPKHHSCGLACVMGGVSCGIVDDKGTLYIAAKSKAYKGCNLMLAPFVAKRVKVKGWLTERGGCKLLKINQVTDLGPAEKFYKNGKPPG